MGCDSCIVARCGRDSGIFPVRGRGSHARECVEIRYYEEVSADPSAIWDELMLKMFLH